MSQETFPIVGQGINIADPDFINTMPEIVWTNEFIKLVNAYFDEDILDTITY